jgi:hypothetical protein
MRRTPGGALLLVLLAGACASTPAPTPPPATPVPSVWDPRRDAIDEHAGIWTSHRPVAYSYTLDHQDGAGDDHAYRYHVSGLEGGVQVQHVAGVRLPDDALADVTVDGLFARARGALTSAAFQVAFDDRTGNPTKLTFAPDANASAGAVETVEDFRTPAAPGEVARAQAALTTLLQRWHGVDAPRWAYTWTRTVPGDAGASPATWTVTHAKGRTTAKPVVAGGAGLTADDVSIDGTVLAIQNVLVSGGWADVATEDSPGLGALIAVDPQPGARGDAYWIRIAPVDLGRQASVSELAAARARWATAQLTDYAYTWQYRGDGGALTYKVVRKGEHATLTRVGNTPAPESRPYAAPRIEDTFAMIEAVLAQGGTVDATYDEELGFPVRVVMHPNGDAGANGVVTIGSLKRH